MFFIILGAVAWIALALWPASVAKRKGYSFVLFLLLGIFVSFLLSLIVAMVLKDKTESAAEKAEDRDVERIMHQEEGID